MINCNRKVQTNSEKPTVKEKQVTSYSQKSSHLTQFLPQSGIFKIINPS